MNSLSTHVSKYHGCLDCVSYGQASQSSKGGRGQLSRKDVRKQDRQDRKSRKAEHHSRAHMQPRERSVTLKRAATHEPPQSSRRKKARFADPLPAQASLAPPEPLPARPTKRIAAPKPKSALEKLDEKSRTAAPLRSEREKQEDAYIAYLENKLGWRKGKDKTKSYGAGLHEDGLDGALLSLFDSALYTTS
jgi:nucleolar MIF4G domain-containing protein 1